MLKIKKIVKKIISRLGLVPYKVVKEVVV